MFQNLSEKFEKIFSKLNQRGFLRQEDIDAALKEIRMALLEADVNFKTVKTFIEDVRNRAVGKELQESIKPGQKVVKIVHEMLVALLGGATTQIKFGARIPAVIMLVGLQGCGKTTSAAKLAYLLSKEEKKIYLVSADVYRPASQKQLEILARQAKIGYFQYGELNDPVAICLNALDEAKRKGCDVLIIDTAGSLHVNEELMNELKAIKEKINPAEILYVADAMTGQDAVNVGAQFHKIINIDGVIMTKMDGDARGGAALSLKTVIEKPIKFVGVGEKIDELEKFHPERIASRILGMGDILTLVEKAKESFDEKQAQKLERKVRKNEFTLEDFRDHLTQINKMGSLKDIVGMIPGMGKTKSLQETKQDDKELIKLTAIIDSMTKEERIKYQIIDGTRRKRIAMGSGTAVQDVNRLLKNYVHVKKMITQFGQRTSVKSMLRNFPF